MDYETFSKKFEKKLKKNFPQIVMERLFTPTYDLDILSMNSKLVQHVIRKRINPKNGNKEGQYNGYSISTNRKFLPLAKLISKIFKLSWLYDCDLMVDKKGQIKILEINPRQSGSIALVNKSGVPIMDQLTSIYFKKKVTAVKLHKLKKILI